MEALHRFRTVLGGFSRRDVLTYIEASDAAHRAQVAQLEQRLAQAEQARCELESALSGAQDERGNAAAEEARVRASLEESSAALARVRGELCETEEQLAAARTELEGLRGKVAQLAPMAEKYEQLKDRVATVELDAHRKAQATVEEAQAQADALREQAGQWLAGVLEEYEALCAALSPLEDKLRDAQGMAENIRACGERAAHLKERGGFA